jgi:microsomal dipeptidase-like Zn-dependent dipeptidase
MGKIFAEMHRRGYSDDEIEKVAGANFLRVFNEVIANSL